MCGFVESGGGEEVEGGAKRGKKDGEVQVGGW